MSEFFIELFSEEIPAKLQISARKNLYENLSKINGEYKDNKLVSEVIEFIEKDKKRPICSPLS